MGKIISFFNHKWWVGKTTLVHNIAFALADEWKKVLLIDADPQMNLTAAMYGLSTSIEYSTENESKWTQYITKYISIAEYIDAQLKNIQTTKKIFTTKSQTGTGEVSLIWGDIQLTLVEADLYSIVRNKNDFTKDIPYKFEMSIRKFLEDYDFILIDTSPSASSIINALMVMSSDYWIAPVAPSFFSLQAIDNLRTIFKNWTELLSGYKDPMGRYPSLSLNVKFLGLVIQMAKRFKWYSAATEQWVSDINNSAKNFHKYAIETGRAISDKEFWDIFWENQTPFVIEKCCDFTPNLRWIAEKNGIPVIYLTQEICWPTDISSDSPNAQYAKSFKSINESYRSIAAGLIKL